MSESSKRIGVVGIDGSGKTSVIRRFLELCPVPERTALTMTCPRYHETPNAPLAELSRQLDAFTEASDALGSFELKATAMYLQMTLFGPVERFFVDTFRPRFVLCEHHALVDTLAYGAFYTQMIRAAPDRGALEAPLLARLGEVAPGALDAIDRWRRAEDHRLGREVPLWELAPYVAGLLRRPRAEVIAEFSRHYRTRLPDVVLLLDLPAEVALARLDQRQGGQREVHEQAPILEKLRLSYHEVLGSLEREHPEVATFVLDTQAADLDQTLREVMERTGIG